MFTLGTVIFEKNMRNFIFFKPKLLFVECISSKQCKYVHAIVRWVVSIPEVDWRYYPEYLCFKKFSTVTCSNLPVPVICYVLEK